MNEVETQLQQLVLQLEEFTEVVRKQQGLLAELSVTASLDLSVEQRRALELPLQTIEEAMQHLTLQLAPGFSDAMQHRLGLLRSYLYD
jgi:hypothetical protein